MINYGDPRKTNVVENPERSVVRSRRAAAATKWLGGSSRANCPLDFSAVSPASVKTSGLASTLDLYAPAVRAEEAQRQEIARRMDALPPHLAALPKKEPDIAVDTLEALAVIEARSKAVGGQPVAVQRGDLARAIKASPERAEAIISDLTRRGLIRRQPTAGTIDYFVLPA